jgi:queuine tRNA-ribosyltransferase
VVKNDTHEVVRTQGGALAMRSLVAGEVMHPGVGPLREAEELYVRQSRLGERLRAANRPLVLFDVGLGAGSNARAAWLASAEAPAGAAPLELISFERDLNALALALAEGAAFGWQGEVAAAGQVLLAHGQHETARTRWRLVPGELPDALAAAGEGVAADMIFWDPFSPRANPELWTVAAFALARKHAGSSATLFTYSASTTTRVALLLAGWHVGIGAGIGAKAETTAAAVALGDLAAPLDARFLSRLSRSDAPLPRDAPSDALALVAQAAQFSPPASPRR